MGVGGGRYWGCTSEMVAYTEGLGAGGGGG